MIYPIDIDSKLTNARQMKGDNKVQLFVTVFVLLNIVMFFGLSFVYSVIFGSNTLAVLITMLILDVGVGSLVFRFAVFDETGKRFEYENGESDSFARYVYVRKELSRTVPIADQDANVFEYVNGSAMCVLQFKYGSTNAGKTRGNEAIFTEMTAAALKAGFSVQHVTMAENFENSKEFRDHIADINRTSDRSLNRTITAVADAVIDNSNIHSNVNTVYMIFRTVTNYQQDDLISLMKRLVEIKSACSSSFRSVRFLNMEELHEMSREFYQVMAIDLSLMKAIERSDELVKEMQNVVSIFSLEGDSGKVYNSASSKNLFVQKEKKIV